MVIGHLGTPICPVAAISNYIRIRQDSPGAFLCMMDGTPASKPWFVSRSVAFYRPLAFHILATASGLELRLWLQWWELRILQSRLWDIGRVHFCSISTCLRASLRPSRGGWQWLVSPQTHRSVHTPHTNWHCL